MSPSTQPQRLRLGVVILAAGASSRMGKPKMLLPWGKTTVIGHLIEQWKDLAAEQICVVCATGDQRLQQELDRVGFPSENRVLNPAPGRGMFSSIQCAAGWPEWNAALSHWAIVLGDQPHLRRETLRALLEFGAAHSKQVCQPGWRGRPRHPVLLPTEVFHRLKDSIAEDLKKFLQVIGASVALCELDDPGLDLDIDRPEDYQRALELCFGKS